MQVKNGTRGRIVMDDIVKEAIREEFDILNEKVDAIMKGLLYQVDGSSMREYKSIDSKRNEITWETEQKLQTR